MTGELCFRLALEPTDRCAVLLRPAFEPVTVVRVILRVCGPCRLARVVVVDLAVRIDAHLDIVVEAETRLVHPVQQLPHLLHLVGRELLGDVQLLPGREHLVADLPHRLFRNARHASLVHLLGGLKLSPGLVDGLFRRALPHTVGGVKRHHAGYLDDLVADLEGHAVVAVSQESGLATDHGIEGRVVARGWDVDHSRHVVAPLPQGLSRNLDGRVVRPGELEPGVVVVEFLHLQGKGAAIAQCREFHDLAFLRFRDLAREGGLRSGVGCGGWLLFVRLLPPGLRRTHGGRQDPLGQFPDPLPLEGAGGDGRLDLCSQRLQLGNGVQAEPRRHIAHVAAPVAKLLDQGSGIGQGGLDLVARLRGHRRLRSRCGRARGPRLAPGAGFADLDAPLLRVGVVPDEAFAVGCLPLLRPGIVQGAVLVGPLSPTVAQQAHQAGSALPRFALVWCLVLVGLDGLIGSAHPGHLGQRLPIGAHSATRSPGASWRRPRCSRPTRSLRLFGGLLDDLVPLAGLAEPAGVADLVRLEGDPHFPQGACRLYLALTGLVIDREHPLCLELAERLGERPALHHRQQPRFPLRPGVRLTQEPRVLDGDPLLGVPHELAAGLVAVPTA